MSDPPKNVSPKKVLVSLNEWVSRKGTFSKNASKRGEFQIVKKTTCPVLLFENLFYSPLFEALKCADLNMYTTLFSHIFDKFLKLKLI